MNLNQIQSIYQRFVDQTLPRELWTHHAHLVVAVVTLSRVPFSEAVNELRNKIKNYNEAVGVGNTGQQGYHESITILFTHLVHKEATSLNIDLATQVVTALDKLGDFEKVLQHYYSYDVKHSTMARHAWCPPDLNPIGIPF